MEITHHTITLHTGVTLHYVHRGTSDGEIIVFLHGYTDSWHSFASVLPLIDSAYCLYALDLRGHGDSERPTAGYTPIDFAVDVNAFLDALAIDHVTLVGHSLGGFIAQQVALTYPQRVQRLVLISASSTAIGHPMITELAQAVVVLDDPINPAFVQAFQMGTLANPIPVDFLAMLVAESLKVPVTVWKQTLAGLAAADFSAQLNRITVPTLILWGDLDGIFTLDQQYMLATRLPNATLKRYVRTGHGLHWEQPRQFVRDLEAFIHDHAPVGGAACCAPYVLIY